MVVRHAAYYSPFYRPFYSAFAWGPYGWWPYWYGPPFAYGYDYASSVRLQIAPREAEVYVDGYLVGTVDNFDGFSQRLRLQPGEHAIDIYHEGYRTLREVMLFRPGESYKIKKEMEKVQPGDPAPARPAPAPRAEAAAPPDGSSRYGQRRWPAGQPFPETQAAGFGTLSLKAQPADAMVFVDGEQWETTADADRFSIELAAGPHRIEVRREGRRTFATTATIRPGEVTTLNVSLPEK